MSQGILQGLQIGSQLGENMFGPRQRRQLLKLQQEAEFERQKELAQFNSDLRVQEDERQQGQFNQGLDALLKPRQTERPGLSNGLVPFVNADGESEQLTPQEAQAKAERFKQITSQPNARGMNVGIGTVQALGSLQDGTGKLEGALVPDKNGLISLSGSARDKPQSFDDFFQEYAQNNGAMYAPLGRKGLAQLRSDAYKQFNDNRKTDLMERSFSLRTDNINADNTRADKNYEFKLKQQEDLNERFKTGQISQKEYRDASLALQKQRYDLSVDQFNYNQQPTNSFSSSTIDPTTGATITNTTRTKGNAPSSPQKQVVIPPYKPGVPPKRG
jgi:hypothetical protein